MNQPTKTAQVDSLRVNVYQTRQDMGASAGQAVVDKINALLAEKPTIRMIFAAAPSQNEVLAYLVQSPDVDWSRIDVFHMDEYVGLSENAPQRFGTFLRQHLFDRVNPRTVNLIDSGADNAEQEYTKRLTEAPIDIVCLGIGENGHIAFNDPPVADFDDPAVIKRVQLDDICRQQQVNDGCFPTFDDVPQEALTLTIPTLMAGSALFCVVPGPTKREAVHQMLAGPITTACPASVLRTHPNCTLYVDEASFGNALP
ncbi:glucosamine-6-phosphate deaminase [Spirosoma linguale]|uniref:Glucosamine/galactosamine-6-phosphate isomerase n=1 Tax=Spirosoma linguale (strain ATCC 33905 / DSM 74 / LMG 10896 / Claus 1) TaxID=504472 RepID=D2QTP0_SPILD|nr:glucosamine/galactosamine-6-phosphate isomerase [Spirosoma linguale DSM 74]